MKLVQMTGRLIQRLHWSPCWRPNQESVPSKRNQRFNATHSSCSVLFDFDGSNISLFYLTYNIRFAWWNVNSCFASLRCHIGKKDTADNKISETKTEHTANFEPEKINSTLTKAVERIHIVLWCECRKSTNTHLFTRARKTRHDNIYDLLTHTPFGPVIKVGWAR